MYFKDLTKYTYGGSVQEAWNIGWLEAGKPMNTGEVSEEFLEKLWNHLAYPVEEYRGFHTCDFCKSAIVEIPVVEREGEKRKVGYYEIRVCGKEGKVYAAPSLIYHYITCHKYQPPQEFIDAVMESDGQL